MEDLNSTRDRLESFFDEEFKNYMENSRLQYHEDQALKSVGQSLLWACALLEFYKKNMNSYQKFLTNDKSSEIIKGIIYSRNRVLHQFIQLVFLTSGAELPAPLPMPFFEIKWKPLKQLPKPDKGHEDPKRAKAYEEMLENRPIRFAFNELSEFFNRIRKESL